MNVKNSPSAENQAPQHNKYLRAIIESSRDAFYVFNEDEKIIDYNQAFLTYTGYSREEAAELYLDDIVPPSERDDKVRNAENLRKIGSDIFTGVVMRKDGALVDTEFSVTHYGAEQFFAMCFMRDITERKKAAKTMLQMHDLMRYIIEHNRSAVSIHDKDLNYMYVSRPYIEVFRLQDADVIGRHHYDVFPDLPQPLRDVHQRVLRGEIVRVDEDEYLYPDGSSHWMRWECRPWYESDGRIGGLVLYAEIITERRMMEQALFNEKELFKTTLLSVGEGVISADKNGVITVMNPVAEKLTGWASEEAVGKPLRQVFSLFREDSGKPFDSYLKYVLRNGRILKLSNNLVMKSEITGEIPVEMCAAPITGSGGGNAGAVIVIRDVTEKRAKQREIEFLSYHDYVTGLYNRRYMENAVRKLDTKRNLPLSLMVIDVNGLKLTNDAFGHEMGDRLLRQVTELLNGACRPGDIIGRMGGDEFCVILPKTDEAQSEQLAERIKAAAARIKSEPIIVSLAVGYAVKHSAKQDVKSVMTTADNLMYKDKVKNGRAVRSQTIEMILNSINLNYSQEQIHTERVSRYCGDFGRALGMSEKEIRNLEMAGEMHDIGKIMVPPQLLNKTDKLTNEEFELIKRHPEIGYQMLKSVDEYTHLAEYVLYHHERYDGAGYPEGLSGDDIPLYARIIAVADAYEAMTSPRPYQKIKSRDAALAELRRCAGAQFDPMLVEVFISRVIDTPAEVT